MFVPLVRFGSTVRFGSDMSRFWFRNPVPTVPKPVRQFRSQPAQNPNIQGGIFLDPKTAQNAPHPPKLKTSKTHTNKPFQELSLKPSYSSHRKDAHSRIPAPKGPNHAKIEFSGPNVRVRIRFRQFRFHPVPVPPLPLVGHLVPPSSGSKSSG